MTYITGLYKLNLDSDQKAKLDAGAHLHSRYSGIKFKIISFNDSEIIVRTEQQKSFHDNIADKKKLIELTKELFSKFLPDHKINVHAQEYLKSPVDIVTPDWVNKAMHMNKIKMKDLAKDLGIDKSTISAGLNGHIELSRYSKAAFFYYFRCKELAAKTKE